MDTNKTEFYSHNDEDFDATDPEEAAERAAQDQEMARGQEGTVYSMEFRKCEPSEFIPFNLAERMLENAYDAIGEPSDVWTIRDASRLQIHVEDAVNAWFRSEEQDCPLWRPVGRSRDLRFRVTDDSGGVEMIDAAR